MNPTELQRMMFERVRAMEDHLLDLQARPTHQQDDPLPGAGAAPIHQVYPGDAELDTRVLERREVAIGGDVLTAQTLVGFNEVPSQEPVPEDTWRVPLWVPEVEGVSDAALAWPTFAAAVDDYLSGVVDWPEDWPDPVGGLDERTHEVQAEYGHTLLGFGTEQGAQSLTADWRVAMWKPGPGEVDNAELAWPSLAELQAWLGLPLLHDETGPESYGVGALGQNTGHDDRYLVKAALNANWSMPGQPVGLDEAEMFALNSGSTVDADEVVAGPLYFGGEARVETNLFCPRYDARVGDDRYAGATVTGKVRVLKADGAGWVDLNLIGGVLCEDVPA